MYHFHKKSSKNYRHRFMSHFVDLNNTYPAGIEFCIFIQRPAIKPAPIESGQNFAFIYAAPSINAAELDSKCI